MVGRVHAGIVPILVAFAGCLAPTAERMRSGAATTGGTVSGDAPDAGAGDAGPSIDAGTPQDAGLELDAGDPPSPSIRCSPSGLDFGLNAVGISSTLNVLCTNVALGSRNLIIGDPSSGASGLSIQNGDRAFSATFDQPFPPIGLAPGESILIDVAYAPTAGGTDGDTLLIANDPVAQVTFVSLAGSAKTLPDCEFSVHPTRVDLGDIEAGVEVTFPLTIINTGPGECLINALAFSNFPGLPAGNPFSLPDYPAGASTSVIIPGGQSLVVQVRLLLTEPGPWEGEIDFGRGFTPKSVTVTAHVLAN